MSAPVDLVIVGAGGHGRQMLDLVDAQNRGPEQAWNFLGFLDDDEDEVDEALLARMGTKLLGPSSLVLDMDAEFAIGVALPEHRRALDTTFLAAGRVATSLLHPTVMSGRLFTHGHGLFASFGSWFDSNVTVGKQFHLNVGVSIGHESRIGDYVTITPGARISGNVTIGDDVYIGTNAVVIQGVTIGDRVTIGAGVSVRRDLPSDIVFTGHKPRSAEEAGALRSVSTEDSLLSGDGPEAHLPAETRSAS